VIATPLLETANAASRFGTAEVIAVFLGAGIALTIAWIGIARARERSYTTTPTLPPDPPKRDQAS
jgi:hypothetical protein